MRHYLDHASTTPLLPAAAAAMRAWIERLGAPEGTGDPSRVHQEGREVREAIEIAREQVADLAGVPASRVVFTSGATEAVNTAVHSAAPDVTLCARVEHSCVREASLSAGEVREIAVASDATLDVDHLRAVLEVVRASRPGGVLVHCQWANHEVGTVQPVDQVAAACHDSGALLHVDAAAAFGHVPLDVAGVGADFVSVTGHKLGGPSGIGALILGRGVRMRPLLVGASEERGRRAGVENLLGIVGFGAAAAELAADGRAALVSGAAEAARLRNGLAAAVTAAGGVGVLGPEGGDVTDRLPHILCCSIEGVLGEAVVLGLDAAGIAAHSGSACSSEALEPSPVLEAMGADPERSLRLSVGWTTLDEDVDAFAAAFPEVVGRLRALAASG